MTPNRRAGIGKRHDAPLDDPNDPSEVDRASAYRTLVSAADLVVCRAAYRQSTSVRAPSRGPLPPVRASSPPTEPHGMTTLLTQTRVVSMWKVESQQWRSAWKMSMR